MIALISSREGQGEAEERPETGQEQPDEGDKDNSKDEETEKPTEAELEAEKEKNVRAIVAKMKSALQEYLVTDEGEKLMDFRDSDSISVLYQAPSMRVAIPLMRSIGFEASGVEAVSENEELWRELWDKIGGANATVGSAVVAEKVFTENGFVKTGEEWVPMGEYINYQTGVVCTDVGSGMPIGFGCGHISWLDEDEAKLADELAEAYEAKEGHTMGMVRIDREIIDSKVKPYQRLTVSLYGAAGMFYRVSPEAKWQFFVATQSSLSCSAYDTEDLRKAYAGEICYEDGEEKTVEP